MACLFILSVGSVQGDGVNDRTAVKIIVCGL